MADNLDIDAGTIVTGEKTVDEVGEEIYRRILDVAGGELTSAERLGHREFGVYRIGPTF